MMIPCDQNREALAAYIDGELSPEQVTAIHQHIRTCPDCAAEIAELIQLKRGLRSARVRYAPSAAFRQKMQQQLAPAKSRPGLLRILPMALALAAILLLTVGWTIHTLRVSAFTEAADLHFNALASSNPLDVVSTDRHTVKPWFQGRIPFSFNLPEFAGTNFALLGGRLVYLHQQPCAQLLIASGQHKISVLIVQDSPALSSLFPIASSAAMHNSMQVETWQSQGLRFLVVGDTERTTIEQLSGAFQRANQP